MRGLCFKLNPSRLAQRAQEIERRISASIIRKKWERKDGVDYVTEIHFLFSAESWQIFVGRSMVRNRSLFTDLTF